MMYKNTNLVKVALMLALLATLTLCWQFIGVSYMGTAIKSTLARLAVIVC